MIYDLPYWNWFLLFFVYVPIVILWVSVIIDVFSRHDMSGWGKVGWLALAFVLPLFGSLIYLAVRPSAAEEVAHTQARRAA